MKDLTRQYLSDADRDRIAAAVKTAEKKTSGEIVPMVVTASYHYPMADIVGGTALALPAALVLTPVTGGALWMGNWNLWVFLGLFVLLFMAGHAIVRRTLVLKRFFISDREINEEVEEAAITSFFREGLYRTRDETGILIFISLFEHRVWVLADRGIDSRVAPGQWDDIVGMIVDGMREKQAAQAICEAVERVGDLLSEHFPIRPDDRDELSNFIVES